MPDDEEPAARSHRGGRAHKDLVARKVRGGVQVLGADQIVAGIRSGVRGGPLGQVGFDERELIFDAGVPGMCRSPVKCDGGNIQAGDVPPLFGEPHGVGTLSAAQLQGGARVQSFYFPDQQGIRVPAPHLRAFAVEPVPKLVGRGHRV